MSDSSAHLSLPDRWLTAAAEDASTDQALLRLINSCRSGASINEPALLKAIVGHAAEIAAESSTAADAELASTEDGMRT